MAEWTKDEQKWHAEMAAVTNNSFETHLKLLKLSPEDLKGKTILVLGPGKDFAFEKGAIDAGAELVIPLAYTYEGHDSPDEVTQERPGIRPIRGLFQELPPANNTFDLIISVQAFPMYAYTNKGPAHAEESLPELRERFTAVFDLLAPGGEARFDCVTKIEKRAVQELCEERPDEMSVELIDVPNVLILRKSSS